MTGTASRAISLENHMKKSPIWGPYASSDRAEKTRAALLEKRFDRCGFASSEKIKKHNGRYGSWPRAKYFLVRHSHSVDKYKVLYYTELRGRH